VISCQLARLRLVVFQASEIDSDGLGFIVSHISESRCGVPGRLVAEGNGTAEVRGLPPFPQKNAERMGHPAFEGGL
jgi:hypothetical protein